MRKMEVVNRMPDLPATLAYGRISSFEAYPTYTRAVRRVEVLDRLEADRSVSSWEVSFNDGILRWTEEDRFQPEERRILFRQLHGDLEHFEGEWQVEEEGTGCAIRFSASFDLGVPTLADMLEPVAEQALRDNIELILSGLRLGRPGSPG